MAVSDSNGNGMTAHAADTIAPGIPAAADTRRREDTQPGAHREEMTGAFEVPDRPAELEPKVAALLRWCGMVGRDTAEIEWGVGVQPDDLERFLAERPAAHQRTRRIMNDDDPGLVRHLLDAAPDRVHPVTAPHRDEEAIEIALGMP